MQLGVRELARAEARKEAGQNAGDTAMDVLANIDAMVLAVDKAALAETFDVSRITAIHQRLLAQAENKHIAGQIGDGARSIRDHPSFRRRQWTHGARTHPRRLIDVLPAHPMITAPVATAATGRAKAAVYEAIEQLRSAGVLIPLSDKRRNQSWEAAGLLDLIAGMESGQPPAEVAASPETLDRPNL